MPTARRFSGAWPISILATGLALVAAPGPRAIADPTSAASGPTGTAPTDPAPATLAGGGRATDVPTRPSPTRGGSASGHMIPDDRATLRSLAPADFRIGVAVPADPAQGASDYQRRLVDVTANRDWDFVPSSIDATIRAGATATDVVVALRDDDRPESVESFELRVQASSAVVADGTGIATITDDDVGLAGPPVPPHARRPVRRGLPADWWVSLPP